MAREIRAARVEDVATAVPLIYSSGPAAFDYIFAGEQIGSCDFLRLAFADGRGEFGYQNHVCVVEDGQVVGIGTTFTSQKTLSFTLHAARQMVKCYGLTAGLGVMRRGLQAERVIQPPKGEQAVLAHLGVAADKRSQGIGAELVAYLLEQARQMGKSTAVLDVAVTNPRAQALYERLGFVVMGERPLKRPSTLANHFGAIVNHRRMEREL